MNENRKMEILQQLGRISPDLYDAALMDADGLTEYRYKPSNHCNDSYSITKAFIMTAIGILQDEGMLNVHDPVLQYLPAYVGVAEKEPRWRRVTLEHALTHTVGYDVPFLDIDSDDVNAYGTEEYLELVFGTPLAYEPGTHYFYTDAVFYLLSRIVSQLTGQTADEFLRVRLTNPLHFREVAWSKDPQGYPIGGTGLYASSYDLAKFGWLYLQRGAFEGKRLLSEQWVEQVLACGYELKPLGHGDLIGKGGMYGQMVLFSPSKGFALSWHGFQTDELFNALVAYAATV